MNEMNHDRAIARLTETGFSPDQSERLVSVIEDVVTARTLTKQDLDLAMMTQRGEFNERLADTNQKIAELRGEMHQEIGGLKAEISRDMRVQTLQTLGGMSAIVGLMLALQKLL
jgi:tetrahydromethanopterin S-methyltransferase subunit G